MLWKRLIAVSLLLVWVSIFFAPPAYAYLDPGSGSYVCQLLLAGLLGAGFIVKAYWAKIQGWQSKFFSRDIRR